MARTSGSLAWFIRADVWGGESMLSGFFGWWLGGSRRGDWESIWVWVAVGGLLRVFVACGDGFFLWVGLRR